jgi:hypothetical protein
VGTAPTVSVTRQPRPGAFRDRKYGPRRRSVGANESRPPTTSGAAENRIEPPPPDTGNWVARLGRQPRYRSIASRSLGMSSHSVFQTRTRRGRGGRSRRRHRPLGGGRQAACRPVASRGFQGDHVGEDVLVVGPKRGRLDHVDGHAQDLLEIEDQAGDVDQGSGRLEVERKSMSLWAPSSPRATDPKIRRLEAPRRAAAASSWGRRSRRRWRRLVPWIGPSIMAGA